MIQIRHALVALVLLPAVVGAQRSRGERGTKADYGAIERDAPPAMKLTTGDLKDISPAKLLIDKRKDLKLTDDQQARLKALRGTVDQTNEPLMAKFDSLRIVMRPRPNPTDEELVRMAIGREELGPVVRSIRANYDASVAQALAVLDDGQKATAQGLLEKQAREADEMVREKLGRAGGRPGGRRPPTL